MISGCYAQKTAKMCLSLSNLGNTSSSIDRNLNTVSGCDHFDGMLIPKNYTVDKVNGIQCSKLNKKGKEVFTEIVCVSDNPVFIEEILEDTVTKKCYYGVSWYNNNEWCKQVFPRKSVSSSKEIEDLLNYNIRFTSNESKLMVEYFKKFVTVNLDKIPQKLQTSTLGWQPAMSSFVLGDKCMTSSICIPDMSTQNIAFYGADEGERQYAKAFQEKGTLKNWLTIVDLVKEFPLVMTGIYAAFSSVLLKIIDSPSFVYDVAYKTSTGKSTLQALSASVWGNPCTGKASIIHTWNNTATWVDNTASMLDGLPLYLDDTKTAGVDMQHKSNNTISNAIYSLASGKGRGRATKDGTQIKNQWSTVLITNGEQKITEFTNNNGGVSARCLSIWGHPFNGTNNQQLITKLKEIAGENYGIAGPAFVQYVLNSREHWEKIKCHKNQMMKLYSDKLKKNEVASRLSEYLAVLRTTGELLAKFFCNSFTNDLAESTIDAIIASVSENADEADRAKVAFETTYSWFARNSHKFEGSDGPVCGETFGRVDDDNGYIAFLVQPLKEFLGREGYEASATLRTWGDNGWLHKGKKGLTSSVRVNKKSQACYRIDYSAIEQVFEIEINSSGKGMILVPEKVETVIDTSYGVF